MDSGGPPRRRLDGESRFRGTSLGMMEADDIEGVDDAGCAGPVMVLNWCVRVSVEVNEW